MQIVVVGIVALACVGLPMMEARTALAATPLGKVVEMLEEMAVKGQAEKNAEEVKFAAFATWCSGITKSKTDEITEGAEKIEMQKATIQKAEARIRALTSRVQELEEDIGRWQKDKKSASDVRTKESADYKATAQDYSESLDALAQAITVLKKQDVNRGQAEFVQTVAKVRALHLVPVSMKKALSAFLQQSQPMEISYEAPEANAYEFQSGGVVEMLEKLKLEFTSKKTDLDKEEMNAQHAYQQIAQMLTDNIENAEFEVSKKKKGTAETQQLKADTEGDLKQTTADKAEDEKYKAESVALCTSKKSDFESRQELRAAELEALKKAVEIIKSESVSGTGEKHLPTLLQYHRERTAAGKATSLAQLRSSAQNPLQERISAFLADRARNIDSRLLALVSQRCAVDPFTKVKKMIKDLISKLMEEATSETEHKGWCDTELTTNTQTRNAKSEEIAKLNADVDELTSDIAQLTQDLEDLSAGVQELDSAMAKATSERSDSKAQNTQTIKEAKEAQAAVAKAIAVLKDYYAKSAEATAFAQKSVQAPAEDAPETFDAPYKGLLPEGGSVVDFLQVILSDFARLESEATTSEATEKDMHEKFMQKAEMDKALKQNEIGHKENTKVDKESDLHATQRELKSTQEQLDKAMAYYEKLKPTCVDSGISYEERVKRREEEIQSLQEALKILAGTDIA
jgi:DNA repair exonuclease SbcCD ATPase subunit